MKGKLVIFRQIRKTVLARNGLSLLSKTKVCPVRAAEGCEKGQHQQKMSSLLFIANGQQPVTTTGT